MKPKANKTRISNTAIGIGAASAIAAIILGAIVNAILYQSAGGQMTEPGLFYGSMV